MNKERIAQCKDALRRSKEFIALDILEQLERENRMVEDILIGEQIETDSLKKVNGQLKENIKNIRKKLFDILTDYEIGNYDSNIHQFYKDVYDIHNELMELAE